MQRDAANERRDERLDETAPRPQVRSAYEPPRILEKRSLERVTLFSGSASPGGGGFGLGG